MKIAALIVALAGLLGLAVMLAARFGPWSSSEETSIHMWIALALGASVSFLLGAGLMALSFHSHAHGYDDAATHDD
jgi:hypothetical protein